MAEGHVSGTQGLLLLLCLGIFLTQGAICGWCLRMNRDLLNLGKCLNYYSISLTTLLPTSFLGLNFSDFEYTSLLASSGLPDYCIVELFLSFFAYSVLLYSGHLRKTKIDHAS